MTAFDRRCGAKPIPIRRKEVKSETAFHVQGKGAHQQVSMYMLSKAEVYGGAISKQSIIEETQTCFQKN